MPSKTIEKSPKSKTTTSWPGPKSVALFDEEQNPIAVIKWKEILDFLEAATDRCEDVANRLEGIVVKHG